MERPFFYLEEQFIKGRRFASLLQFLQELDRFERDDLDLGAAEINADAHRK